MGRKDNEVDIGLFKFGAVLAVCYTAYKIAELFAG